VETTDKDREKRERSFCMVASKTQLRSDGRVAFVVI
jgi:hypothetical protein